MKIPEGSMTQRREAMESMVESGKAMLAAHAGHGFFELPKEYNAIAEQVREFIEWRKSLEFKVEKRTLEELI